MSEAERKAQREWERIAELLGTIGAHDAARELRELPGLVGDRHEPTVRPALRLIRGGRDAG